MPNLTTDLLYTLNRNGLKATITSVAHIAALKDEIMGLKEQSLLGERFYNENLSWFKFDYADALPDAKSIIVIAYPQLMTRLNFTYQDRKHTVILPHTYVYSREFERVQEILAQVLEPHHYKFERASLPAKLLAVRTGLAMYGRNNICYVNGMGSYHRLFYFYTNMPPAIDNWGEKTVMPECSSCGACIDACPTKAIDRERFLIDAEKCITHFNESGGDFPEWFDKGWHNALVGCMKCQLSCPQNRDFIGRSEREVTFESEETRMILQKTPLELLPPTLKQKLNNLDLTDYYEIVHRNLSVLIQ